MPYESDKQRRFMHAVHPEIAKRWDAEARKAHDPHMGDAILDAIFNPTPQGGTHTTDEYPKPSGNYKGAS